MLIFLPIIGMLSIILFFFLSKGDWETFILSIIPTVAVTSFYWVLNYRSWKDYEYEEVVIAILKESLDHFEQQFQNLLANKQELNQIICKYLETYTQIDGANIEIENVLHSSMYVKVFYTIQTHDNPKKSEEIIMHDNLKIFFDNVNRGTVEEK